MTIHSWNGPQQRLGNPAVVADAMTVRWFEEGQAEGAFAFVDYAESGIRGEETWEAKRQPDIAGNVWTVRCTTSSTVWHDAQHVFTIDQAVNQAIRRFVSEKLEIIREHGKLPELPTFTGKIDPYTGPCVCDKLSEQNMGGEISWQSLAKERESPPRVHSCHCGRKWWNWDENGFNEWIEVGEESLWEDIVAHNGTPRSYIGVMYGQAFTAQTLRNQGYIPIG